jgi:hypothetical protein
MFWYIDDKECRNPADPTKQLPLKLPKRSKRRKPEDRLAADGGSNRQHHRAVRRRLRRVPASGGESLTQCDCNPRLGFEGIQSREEVVEPAHRVSVRSAFQSVFGSLKFTA